MDWPDFIRFDGEHDLMTTELSVRLDELETRYALLEHSFQELNDVVTGQWQLIDRLQRQVEGLKTEFDSAWPGEGADQPEPPPPHY